MPDKETSRLEAFSDGVFAIAMTLLIIDIRLPPMTHETSNRELLRALGALWPSYLSFFISFVTVLIMWINHHGLFRLIHTFNQRFLFANGFVLLMVTVVNFPTKVVADHLGEAGANVAVALYCGTYVLVAVSYNLMFYAALPNMSPEARDGPHSSVPRIRRAYLAGLFVYAAATVIGLFSPYLGLLICMMLWVLWMLLDYRPGRRRARAAAGESDRGLTAT